MTNLMMTAANDAVSTVTSEIKDQEKLTEGALLDAVLRRDNLAWQELMRRYDPMLRTVVRRRLARALRTVLPSDAIDDVMGAFYLDLVEGQMRKLRTWGDGPRKSKLSTWLTMIACQIAVEHIRASYSRRRLPRQLCEDNRDTDPNRGGAWIGELQNAGENTKRKRRTKTVEDELRELQAQHAERLVA